MKPASFEYLAPSTFDEAVRLMAEHGDAARPLAGGQSLVALMNTRIIQPEVIIDLHRCPGLDAIEDNDGAVTISAMVRQSAAGASRLVRERCPLLAAALPHVGGTANRNRGTICGSLAHADPLAELPCVAVALDATFVIVGPRGRRSVAASAFFRSALSTAIEADELLRAVSFPAAKTGSRAAFVEIGRNRRHGFALAGAAAQLQLSEDGTCLSARIALMGLGDIPIRWPEGETALAGQRLTRGLLRDVAQQWATGIEIRSDIHASAEYRRTIASTVVERALTEAGLVPAESAR
ncbi:FAD binding domain-containing protein [Pseudorhodoplanes sp.]|uniref:FAD binding domain-containing protein n=1 Tax=Pseudorhodoplanes sp. TaxID=1934341 RepID=UPI003D0B9055